MMSFHDVNINLYISSKGGDMEILINILKSVDQISLKKYRKYSTMSNDEIIDYKQRFKEWYFFFFFLIKP